MPGGIIHAAHGKTMGTTWSLKYVAVKSMDEALVTAGVERRLAKVIDQMSTWQASSNLSRFNAAPAGSRHVLPPEFFRVLQCALQVAEQSGGAFDPGAGALVNAWGFGPTNRYDEAGFEAPSPDAVEKARAAGGWQRVELDEASRTALQRGGVHLDFSAIAKGFAVDHVAAYLRGLGIADSLVEIGGELRGAGIKPDGQPWWVALEQPPTRDSDASDRQSLSVHHDAKTRPPQSENASALTETVVALHELSVATSGDYRRFHMQGGTRRSHTIDPRTGLPIDASLASVTVLHRDCMLADAWSTALGVLGAERGLEVARERDLPALFVTRTATGFMERMSEPMQALLA